MTSQELLEDETDGSAHSRTVARILFVALGYCLAGKLSLLLAIPPGYATAVWPPAGVALAAMMVWGRRILPGVWIGSFILNSWITWNNTHALTPVSLVCAGGIGFGAVSQAYVGELLLRRATGIYPHTLDTLGSVARFISISGLASSVVGASNGVFWLWAVGFVPVDQILNSWWTWWIGDAIGVMIFTPVILVFLGRPRKLWQWRGMSVALPLILAFSAVVTFYIWNSSVERSRIQREFNALAGSMNQSFLNEINSSEESLCSLRDLCALSEGPVSSQQFTGFARTFLNRRNSAAALAWIERVPAERRAAFEAVHGEIWQKNADTKVRANNHAEYFPILYSEPSSINKGAPGFDLASNETRYTVLKASAECGEMVASPKIYLVQDSSPKPSIQIALPVYKAGVALDSAASRAANLRGFTSFVLRLEQFLNVAMPHDGLGIDVQLLDLSASSGEEVLYDSFHDGDAKHGPSLFTSQTELNVGGRKWELNLRSTPEYLASHGSSNSWVVLAGGLVLVSLLGAFLLVLTGRTSHVEVLVAERTEALEMQMAELNRTQSALRTSDARFRSYFDLGMIGMCITSPTKGWVDVNDAICGQFGYSREQMSKLTWAELTHPEDLASDVALFNRVLLGEINGYNLDKRFIRKDGAIFYAAISVSCVRKDDQSIDYFIAMIQDISERQRVRDAMVKAKESAEAASRAKGEFLATMSHEIRTPMNGVIGFTELLLETPLSKEQRDYIRAIKNSGQVLLSLINDILDFSKIDAGKMEVESTDFDIEAVSIEVCNLLRAQSQDKGLTLTIDIDSDAKKIVTADPLRSRQVLLNLVGNAIKFTKHGGINILIGGPQTDAKKRRVVRISVSDTGIGIPAEKQEQLFQKFMQADSSTTRKFGGTGLGLAICKRLVELMGGEIVFKSSPGEGSVFSFTLPLSESDVASNVSARLRRPTDAFIDPAELDGIFYNVLLAEDNVINQMLARTMLEKMGCRIDLAVNGEEAVKKMRSKKYAIVFMDCHMPEVDGYSATRKIRQWETEKNSSAERTPIIALTANAFKGDEEECRAAGMDDYLTKPVSKDAIRQMLDKWAKPESRSHTKANPN